MTKTYRLLGPILLLVALVWTLVRSGTGLLPDIGGPRSAAQSWPTRPVGEFTAFFSDSPVGLIAFQLLGLESDQDFYRLHAVAILLAISAIAAWAFVVSAESQARWKAARLTVLAPISAVMLAWIGSYDPFTMLAWAIALFAWRAGRTWALIATGIILGFQHFEQALLGLIALTLAWTALKSLLPKNFPQVNPMWILPGLVIGKIVLLAVFVSTGQDLSGRDQWIGPFLRQWVTVGVNIGPLLLWSLFAGFWAVFAVLFLSVDRRARWILAAMLALGLIALFLSEDRPRVFVVALAPAVVIFAVAFAHSVRGREAVVSEVIVWLGVPVLFLSKDVSNENVVDLLTVAWQVIRG